MRALEVAERPPEPLFAWLPVAALTTLGVLPMDLSPRFGKGGTIQPFGPGGVKITATRAEHSSEYAWKNPATTKDEVHVGGEPVGFIVEMENGFKVYHMGDTGLFGDMKFIGEYYKPDLVLIPIGGHFVMSPADAAYAVGERVFRQDSGGETLVDRIFVGARSERGRWVLTEFRLTTE